MTSDKLILVDPQKYFLERVEGADEYINKWEFLLRFFPEHLVTNFVNEPTSGWSKMDWNEMTSEQPGTEASVKGESDRVIHKHSYFLKEDINNDFFQGDNSRIFLAGMDTDACIYAIALELFEKGYRVNLIEDACS